MRPLESLLPSLPANDSQPGAFSFKYRLPGMVAPSQSDTQYALQPLDCVPSENAADPFSLCVLPAKDRPAVFSRFCHPYYVLVGNTTRRARACVVAFSKDESATATVAQVSPAIYSYFEGEKTVGVDKYINFLYRPLPAAKRLVVQELCLHERYSSPIPSPTHKLAFVGEKVPRVVLPGDTLCGPNGGVFKVISIGYEGAGKTSESVHTPPVVGPAGVPLPGFLWDSHTDLVHLDGGSARDLVHYPILDFFQKQCRQSQEGPSVDFRTRVRSIGETAGEVLAAIRKAAGGGVKFAMLNGGDDLDREEVVRILARDLSLAVQERNLAFALTTTELVETLTGGIEFAAPVLVFCRNTQNIQTVISATCEGQKLDEKQVKAELLRAVKERYRSVGKKCAGRELVLVFVAENAEELLGQICGSNVFVVKSPSREDRGYILNTCCEYWAKKYADIDAFRNFDRGRLDYYAE